MAGKAMVIFDFDGTVADSFAVATELLVKAAPDFGLPAPTPEKIEQWRSMTLRQIVKNEGVSLAKATRMLWRLQNDMARHMADIPPHQGMPALLKDLARDYSVALVSSNSTRNLSTWVSKQKLGNHFAGVFGGTSLLGKASKLRRVLAAQGISAKRAIYVGDEARDIEAANHIGLAAVGVAWGFQTTNLLHAAKPLAVAKDATALEAIIRCHLPYPTR